MVIRLRQLLTPGSLHRRVHQHRSKQTIKEMWAGHKTRMCNYSIPSPILIWSKREGNWLSLSSFHSNIRPARSIPSNKGTNVDCMDASDWIIVFNASHHGSPERLLFPSFLNDICLSGSLHFNLFLLTIVFHLSPTFASLTWTSINIQPPCEQQTPGP